MYRKNQRAQQPLLLSDINDLPERSLKHLKNSWAETFRREVFLRIPEDRFAVLYASDPSRPNVPVNVLVGLDILKDWRGWSDEELYEHFLFDLQVRYALGCDNFGEDDFDVRTLYYFRQRLSEYALKTGENLLKQVFEHITDAQIKKLEVKTGMLRMDSTYLMSNIADLSRLELLVGALQRLHGILSKTDQVAYAELFRPFIQEGPGQYTYRIKGRQAVWEHIQKVGEVLNELLAKLAEGYGEEPVYQVAQRFFEENFSRVENRVKAKTNQEISPGCLQSLDDLEASYVQKRNKEYKGYVANLAETCDPSNPVQLITHVQVAPNRTHDKELLKAVLPELKERTELETLVTDAGYIAQEVDQALAEQNIVQLPSNLTGTLPNHEEGKLALSDFDMELDNECLITKATCPAGHPAQVHTSKSGKSFVLSLPPKICLNCPHFQQGQCPIQANQPKNRFSLPVPKERAISSQRRRRFERFKEDARRLRTAVEATVFQVKSSFRGGKTHVRGLTRMTHVVMNSALAVNLRRIHRYEQGKQRGKHTSKIGKAFIFAPWRVLCRLIQKSATGLGTCFSF